MTLLLNYARKNQKNANRGAEYDEATKLIVDVADAAASKGLHVGKLWASWCREKNLAVRVPHQDNALRGFIVRLRWRKVWSPLLFVLGCLHNSHATRISPASWAASVFALPPRRCMSPRRVTFVAFPPLHRWSFLLFSRVIFARLCIVQPCFPLPCA
jgi:hypothetical protein